MEKEGSIYVLYHPVTGEVRYVGQTANRVSYRVHGHRSDALRGAPAHVSRWYAKCVREGNEPRALVWERVAADQLDERERFWIYGFRKHGHRLTNIESGGNLNKSGARHTPEAREKIAASKRGKPRSPETVAKIKATKAANPYTPTAEHREAISRANRGVSRGVGRKHSAEHRAAISKGLSGHKRSSEFRGEVARRQRGGANSRAKLNEAQVWEIKELLRTTTHTQTFIASLYGVTPPHIGNIKRGKLWSHVTLGGGDL